MKGEIYNSHTSKAINLTNGIQKPGAIFLCDSFPWENLRCHRFWKGQNSRRLIITDFSSLWSLHFFFMLYIHGSSFFGLSEVRITTSLLSVAIFVIMGRFPLSLSPAQPKTSQKPWKLVRQWFHSLWTLNNAKATAF